MAQYTSIKWISAEESRAGRRLVVHGIDEALRNIPPIDASGSRKRAVPINLISIFGRARQGKSFLMNCLAGESDIFKISNEKESCTQGIDLSSKWMTLRQFSSLDGGEKRDGPAAIGFVDAEGQGDRDVTYDARLVCPILLASKSVIFNWKGDLQKDHLLGTLGVMARAASNVASESAGKKFGHLHVIFRDWQAVSASGSNGIGSSATDPAAAAVFRDLFEEERSADAMSRNQIRRDILSNFQTVSVWLFDPPTETTAALRQKLTFQVTTKEFKAQVRALRNVLADQLSTPTVTATTTLTTANLGHLVNAITTALNDGHVVLPSDAYVNMMQQEIHQHIQKLEHAIDATFSESMVKLEETLSRQQSELLSYQRNYQRNVFEYLSSKKSPDHFFPSEATASAAFQEFLDRLIALESRTIYRTVFGEDAENDDCLKVSSVNPLSERLFGSLASKIATIRERSMNHFLASHKELLSRMLTISRGVAEVITEATIQAIKGRLEPQLEESIIQELTELRQLSHKILGSTYYSESSKVLIDAAVRSVNSTIDRATEDVLQHNREIIQREDELARSICAQCVVQMQQAMESFIQNARERIEGGLADYIDFLEAEAYMNGEYTKVKAIIDNKGLNPRTTSGIQREFNRHCVIMRETLKKLYVSLVPAAFKRIVEDHIPLLHEQFKAVETIEVEDENDFENHLLEQRAGVVNRALARAAKWDVETEIEDELIETPLEEASAAIIEEYMQRYRHAAAQARAASTSTDQEEEIAKPEPVNTKAASSSKSKAAEERERARQYAIAQGFISADGKSKKKKTTEPTKAKKTGIAMLSTREDVDAARRKAKEWAQRTFGEDVLDENLPWSGNRPSLDGSRDYQAGKAVVASARNQMQAEIEERTKRAVESIRSDPTIGKSKKARK